MRGPSPRLLSAAMPDRGGEEQTEHDSAAPGVSERDHDLSREDLAQEPERRMCRLPKELADPMDHALACDRVGRSTTEEIVDKLQSVFAMEEEVACQGGTRQCFWLWRTESTQQDPLLSPRPRQQDREWVGMSPRIRQPMVQRFAVMGVLIGTLGSHSSVTRVVLSGMNSLGASRLYASTGKIGLRAHHDLSRWTDC